MSCSACLFVFLGTLARFGDRQGVVRELNDASQEAVFPVRARVGATEHRGTRHHPWSRRAWKHPGGLVKVLQIRPPRPQDFTMNILRQTAMMQ